MYRFIVDFLRDFAALIGYSFILFGLIFFPARMYFPGESYIHVLNVITLLRESALGDTWLTRPIDYFILNQLDGISFGFFIWACWVCVKRSCRSCWNKVRNLTSKRAK